MTDEYFFCSIKFFKYIGGVVSVRLIVNHQGKHVGYAFVEFVDAKRANLVSTFFSCSYILIMKN